MRNEDLSHNASNGHDLSGGTVAAHDDYDVIPAGAHAPATGNALTGAGTVSGRAGADALGSNHAQLVSISGASGTDSDPHGGIFHIEGRYGSLRIDSHGNYTYVRNAASPTGVTDTFTYAIADDAGHRDSAHLSIRIEAEHQNLANAQRVTPGPDGVVALPAGVSLSDVHVVGRDLVIDMPDGTHMLIVDGAVFVPQLAFGGVEVPATNLAALLIDSEPLPAAGTPQSSGGDFAVPVAPLDPGVPLGDLIPPTELSYIPPDFRDIGQIVVDHKPTVFIETPDQPAGATDATATVDEGALPARGLEPEGSHSASTAEATVGTIVYTSQDTPNTITLNGVAITGVNQVIHGAFGDLTITSIADGAIGYSYVLLDNTSGDTTHDDFTVVVTDRDGDSATATLTVHIADDVPTANPDVDSVTEDGALVADGNVITGVGGTDANTTDGVKDVQGADGAHVTSFAHGSTSGTFGTPLAGDHGSLVLNADGSYAYTLNNADPFVQALHAGQTATEVFSYTITDGDGDTSSTTLTITIVGTNDQPVIGSASVAVSEEGLPAGIADGNGIPTAAADTTNSATVSGTLTVSDPDGDPVSLTLGAPAGSFASHGNAIAWTLSSDGHTLTGSAGGSTVITVALDNSGHFDVTLTGSLDHPDTAGEDAFNIVFPVTGSDGSLSSGGSITVQIEDDMPVVAAVVDGSPALSVDETALGTDATASFAGSFAVNFGADGPGATPIVYSLGISGDGAASGLVDTASGEAVLLRVTGSGVVEGYTATSNLVVFSVSVDAAGSVTLDQQRAVVHTSSDNPDTSEPASLTSNDLVTLTAMATDADGDHASQTIAIGSNLVFLDDGPSAGVTGGSEPTLTVDETLLGTDASASFAGLFTHAFGNDGAGAGGGLSYTLSATTGASGLIDTATGLAVVLSVNGSGQVIGTAGAGGPTVFTVSVDASGTVTLDQARAVVHTVSTNPDSSEAAASIADGLIVLTQTVTDKDGDTATSHVDIGSNLVFLDDGPSAGVTGGSEPTLTVDETLLGTDASASFAGLFTHAFGNDGAGAGGGLSYTLSATTGASGLIDTATGLAVVLSVNGSGQVIGTAGAGGPTVFTVSVDASGTVTLDQARAVVHTVSTNPDSSEAAGSIADGLIVLTQTVTDKDGDTATSHVDIGSNLVFLDDGPSAGVTGGSEPTLTVDETLLGTDASASFAGLFTHAFGNDGAGAGGGLSYTLSATTGASGLIDTATGLAVVLSVNGSGQVIGTAGAGGPTVFTVSVDASGTVTLDQARAVVHTVSTNPDSSEAAASIADGLIVLTQTVTDKDGDTATSHVDIGSNLVFLDDGPSAAIAVTGLAISADESIGNQTDSNDVTGPLSVFAGVLNPGHDADNGGNPLAYALSTGAVSSVGTTFGADGGTRAFSLTTADGTDSGLNTTEGSDILLYKEGDLIVGRVGSQAGAAAFAIAIDASSGQISLVEYLSIQHPISTNPDDSVSIIQGAISAVVTATDGDGDTSTASAAIGNLISFQDSAPIMTGASNINIQNSGSVANSGAFAYNLGADGAPTSNDVFKAISGTATVNGTAVQNYTISETSETATSAVFGFSFDYANGSGTTAHETGTLTFDKTNGTYTVDLTDPIAGFTVVGTAGAPASAFVNYNSNGTTSQGPSTIATVGLSSNLFIQFTGDNGTIGTTVAPSSTFTPTTTSNFANLELFNGSAATVTVSSSAAGVAGNTIQGGEVLDFNLYATDPHGTTGGVPTASATSMFIDLDGVGTSEDLIVVLKLFDTVTHQYTTEALMVQNGDIITSNATLAGTAYAGITLDNNDGLIVIEANDYQGGNTNLVIVGAQIAGSDAGITGTAINFNGALGGSGGSSGTQPFSTDVSDAPFKIQNIGFLTTNTTNQTAHLTFTPTIQDGDGDSISQTITADVTSAANSSTPITLSSSVTTVSPVVLDTNHDGQISYLGTGAGVVYDVNHDGTGDHTAWVAPGDFDPVFDADHNGTVTNASEFVFGGNGVTDMEALHAQYGAQLDASDAGFTQFGLWNDANSNGIVDAGEVKTLAEAGITSIGLVSDGVAATYAGGDVQVAGSASFTYVNDNGTVSQGKADDASFAYRSASSDLEQRLVAASTGYGVVAAAVAAMGLAASQAAAATDNHSAESHAQGAATVVSTVVGYTASVAADPATDHSLLQSEAKVVLDSQGSAQASRPLPTAGDAWDSGHFGGFTPQAVPTIAMEAMVLHHDAAPAA